ncbi:ABC transporter permease [Thalassotalea agarivorans]|uniref:Sodium transport system permease protein n=1 Tax=Thalassotalea agarivorans TaxID=349064 RepID=A0A1I0DI47_THASX|nr:ABC transporter permease [Thalassotalea agarivorans]SET32142.1 sodium transport system permease protein [Thalassotalea agarivorans]
MFQVYLKELLELVRDRKTLFFIIALPLLIFPVIFGVMGAIVANVVIDEQKRVVEYAIVNEKQAPEFAEKMFYHRDFTRVEMTFDTTQQMKDAIVNGQVELVIVISDDHKSKLDANAKDVWHIYYNNASQINSIKQKINKVLAPYQDKVRNARLENLGITMLEYEQLDTPVALKTIDTADKRESVGEKIGGIIPYLLIVLCLTGAMYPAIDIGAGEKERGTLETLLLTPISRLSLVLGKFLTIMTTAVLTAVITVLSLVLWGFIFGEILGLDTVKQVLATIGTGDLLLILLMLIPVSSIFAALLLAISIYARSYKEAQNYMGPMTILGFFPVMIAMLPGIKLEGVWSLVPITNVALAIKEILKGTIEAPIFIAIFLSTFVFAMIAIAFCVQWFKKEAVLFR